MITASNLLDILVEQRFYIWDRDKKVSKVYENLPEEDENVKKCIFTGTPEEARAFLLLHKKKLKAYLSNAFKVSAKRNAPKIPTPS